MQMTILGRTWPIMGCSAIVANLLVLIQFVGGSAVFAQETALKQGFSLYPLDLCVNDQGLA